MESSIAVFLMRQIACELLPTNGFFPRVQCSCRRSCAAALVCSTCVVVLSALCCLRSLFHYLLSKIHVFVYTCESPRLSLNHLDCNMNIYCYYIDDDGICARLEHIRRYQRCRHPNSQTLFKISIRHYSISNLVCIASYSIVIPGSLQTRRSRSWRTRRSSCLHST